MGSLLWLFYFTDNISKVQPVVPVIWPSFFTSCSSALKDENSRRIMYSMGLLHWSAVREAYVITGPRNLLWVIKIRFACLLQFSA
jgi:hypothetical protein